MRTHHLPEIVVGDYYALRYDPIASILRIMVRDFWPPAVSREFLDALATLVRATRVRSPDLFVSIDAVAADVHSASAVADYACAAMAIYRAEDHIAVAASSALVRMQFRRFLTTATISYHGTVAEAETWLLAQRRGRP